MFSFAKWRLSHSYLQKWSLTLSTFLLKEQRKFQSTAECGLALDIVSEDSQELGITFSQSYGSQFEV